MVTHVPHLPSGRKQSFQVCFLKLMGVLLYLFVVFFDCLCLKRLLCGWLLGWSSIVVVFLWRRYGFGWQLFRLLCLGFVRLLLFRLLCLGFVYRVLSVLVRCQGFAVAMFLRLLGCPVAPPWVLLVLAISCIFGSS